MEKLKKEKEETDRFIEEKATEMRMKECAFWFFEQIKSDPSKIIKSRECRTQLSIFEPIHTETLRRTLRTYCLQLVVDKEETLLLDYGRFRVGRNVPANGRHDANGRRIPRSAT